MTSSGKVVCRWLKTLYRRLFIPVLIRAAILHLKDDLTVCTFKCNSHKVSAPGNQNKIVVVSGIDTARAKMHFQIEYDATLRNQTLLRFL